MPARLIKCPECETDKPRNQIDKRNGICHSCNYIRLSEVIMKKNTEEK